MKNVFLAVALSVLAVPAFAGSCPCETERVVTKTVVTTTEVVKAPVRVVGGLRARLAARRAARLEARQERAERLAAACCAAADCGCEATEAK